MTEPIKIDWARIETIMVRVLGKRKARVADMIQLRRAFRSSPKKYSEIRNRVEAKLGGSDEAE